MSPRLSIPELTYVQVEQDDKVFYLAKDAVEQRAPGRPRGSRTSSRAPI